MSTHSGKMSTPSVRAGQFDTFREKDKPASCVYNRVGSTLEEYIALKESQYIDLMYNAFGMIGNGAKVVSQKIRNGEFI